jgi:hypothetical protein
MIKKFPARESLVSDIPTGDGKTANLFLQSIDWVVAVLLACFSGFWTLKWGAARPSPHPIQLHCSYKENPQKTHVCDKI